MECPKITPKMVDGKFIKTNVEYKFQEIIDLIHFEAENNPCVLDKYVFLSQVKVAVEKMIQENYRD